MHWLSVAFRWIEVHTGTVNEAGPYYGFFSGFGSDIGEVAIVGAVVSGYKKVNCHSKGCFRIAHHDYVIDGTTYKLCRKCHPHVNNGERLTRESFAQHAHPSSQKRDPRGRFAK